MRTRQVRKRKWVITSPPVDDLKSHQKDVISSSIDAELKEISKNSAPFCVHSHTSCQIRKHCLTGNKKVLKNRKLLEQKDVCTRNRDDNDDDDDDDGDDDDDDDDHKENKTYCMRNPNPWRFDGVTLKKRDINSETTLDEEEGKKKNKHKNGKNKDKIRHENQCQVHVVHEHQFIIPEFLTHEVWDRHELSLEDVEQLLRSFSPEKLWVLVLSLGMLISTSRLTESSSKRFAIAQLLQHLSSSKWTHRKKSRLCNQMMFLDSASASPLTDPTEKTKGSTEADSSSSSSSSSSASKSKKRQTGPDRKPVDVGSNHHAWDPQCLVENRPVHRLTIDDFRRLTNTKSTNSTLFSWRGIVITPLQQVASHVLLVGRVIPYTAYIAIWGKPSNLIRCPLLFSDAEGQCWALTEECFYFYF
jgi:hypothetical protein